MSLQYLHRPYDERAYRVVDYPTVGVQRTTVIDAATGVVLHRDFCCVSHNPPCAAPAPVVPPPRRGLRLTDGARA